MHTQPGARLANFQYAAPEQRTRGGVVDARADIYALGLMLNEMFTGSVPLAPGYPTVASVAPTYRAVDDLVAAMIQQSPNARPHSIDDVRQRLPSSAVGDPLVTDPVRVVDTDATVANALTLVLNHAPTPKWKAAMAQVGRYRHFEGFDPRHMTIVGNRVTIRADRSLGVPLVAVAGSYVEFFKAMAVAYPQALAREEEQRSSEARAAEQARVEAERRRLELNKALGI